MTSTGDGNRPKKKNHSATCGNGELGRLGSIKLTKQPTKGACSKQGDTLAPFSIDSGVIVSLVPN